MFGQGRYDSQCTTARQSAKARGAILIIVSGEHGHGFSAQLHPDDIARMPATLRQVADTIEKDFDRLTQS